MTGKYSSYNEQTGEYIETRFDLLDLPEDLKRPNLDGVERTMNLGITRASGWHYADRDMLFIPAYSKVSGQSLGLTLSLYNDNGNPHREGIVFLFSKSRSFPSKITLADALYIAFGVSDWEQVRSLVGMDSKFISAKYFPKPDIKAITKRIRHKGLKAGVDLTGKLRLMLTKQTVIGEPSRVYDMFDLTHFLGCTLAESITLNNTVVSRFTILDEELVFRILHSGIDSIKLLTQDQQLINITLMPNMYVKLEREVNKFSHADRIEFIRLEMHHNQFEFNGKVYSKIGVPQYNNLDMYMMILNRMIVFELINKTFSMQDYHNQKIVKFEEKIRDFELSDLEQVDYRVNSMSNMLSAVSGIPFDKGRAERLIKNADSALAVITKNENPIARTSQGNVLVRDVGFLAREAVQVLAQDLGVIDPVDSTESKNIGKTTPLTMTTKLGENGILLVPLYKVINGQVTKIVEDVPVGELPNLFVAEHGAVLTGNVLAKHRGELKLYHSSLITHVRVSPFSTSSYCRGASVFMENTDQKRAQMTANAMKQARTILKPKRALVETGVESIVARGAEESHYFTVKEILEGAGYSPDTLKGHKFRMDSVANTGMAKEFKLVSTTEEGIFANFTVKTEKTVYGAAYYFELVPPKNDNLFYSLDDVAYKQHNIIFGGNVKGTNRLDYHTQGNADFFDVTTATGLDLFVMFGLRESFTVDDASVISDRLVRDMSFATPVVFSKTHKINKFLDPTLKQKDGLIDDLPKEGFKNGLPLIGTYLRPGQKWYYKYVTDLNTKKSYPQDLRLTDTEEGEVIAVHVDEDEIKVTLAKWIQIKVGDKISARHGNKSIIAKVIRAEHMPYDPKTGRHVDLIINPLGVPSRGNYSQIGELQKAAEIKEAGYDSEIIPPFSNELFKLVENFEKGAELTEIQFINSENGLYYPQKHFAGYMHYLRSVHITEDKYHAIGSSRELDAAYGQPVGGHHFHEKGQSISSMEKELLLSYGAEGILDEIHSILSADQVGFEKVSQMFVDDPLAMEVEYIGRNRQAKGMQEACMGLHISLGQDEDKISVRYMSDEDMEDYIPISKTQTTDQLTSKLFSKDIMRIDLEQPFLTPVAVKKFTFASLIPTRRFKTKNGKIDKTPGFMGKDAMEDIIFSRFVFAIGLFDSRSEVVLLPAEDKDFYIQELGMNNLDFKSGMRELINLLIEYPIEFWIEQTPGKDNNFIVKDPFSGQFTRNEDLANRYYKALAIKENGGFKRFINYRYPVLPNKYRQAKNAINNKNSLSYAYKDIMDIGQQYVRNSDMGRRLYERMGLLSEQLFEFFAKKDKGGRIRGKILKTRVKCSMRSTIVPMFSGDPAKYGYPSWAGHPDSIGLPLVGALRIAQPRVMGFIKNNYPELVVPNESDIETVSKVIDVLTLPYTSVAELIDRPKKAVIPYVAELKKKLVNLLNGSYIFYGRAPSLHETSQRGARIYVHDEKVIHLHSLLTTDFNADHDGDAMYIVMPFTKAAIKDIKERLLPSNNVLRYNEGNPSLIISQDALLGLYFATLNPTSEQEVSVKDVEHTRYLLELGLIDFNTRIAVNTQVGFSKSLVHTTAGRFILHNIMFRHTAWNNYKESKDDRTGKFINVPYMNGVISSKGSGNGNFSIAGLQKGIFEMDIFTEVEVTSIYNEMQQFGYFAAEKRNMTLGIRDLSPALAVPSINKEIKKYVEDARTLEELGALPKDYLVFLDDKVRTMVDKMNVMSYLPENNTFRHMVTSGAKGKEGGIQKMFTVQGFISGNNDSKLPTPVLNNAVKGLSQFQVEDLSYTQRDNAISTVFETSKPGETLRSGAFMLSGLVIQEDKPLASYDDAIHQMCFYNKKYYYKVRVGETLENSIRFEDLDKMDYIEVSGTEVDEDYIRRLISAGVDKVLLDDGRTLFIDLTPTRRVWLGNSLDDKEPFISDRKLTYKGRPLTSILVGQLNDSGKPRIKIDQDDLFLFFEVEHNPLATALFTNKFTHWGELVNKKDIENMLEGFPESLPINTYINEFSQHYGVSQNNAGVRLGKKNKFGIKENVGIKASTATSEPANQLVISKRNMDRSGGLDNGIDLFKIAIQSGTFYRDDYTAFEMLCPEDGYIRIYQDKFGTELVLYSPRGFEYSHKIKAADENKFDILVRDGALVFKGQTVIRPEYLTEDERAVHPLLSFVWTNVTVDFKENSKVSLLDENGVETISDNEIFITPVKLKGVLPNPDHELIQLMRFYHMMYLESIYRSNGINLDPNHYVAFSLQTTRFGQVIMVANDDDTLPKTGFMNVVDYLQHPKRESNDFIFNMTITNNYKTVMLTAGSIAGIAYRDPIAVASVASLQGSLPEFGYLGKIALGVSLRDNLGKRKVIKTHKSKHTVTNLTPQDSGEEVKVQFEEVKLEEGIEFDFSSFYGDDTGIQPQEEVVKPEVVHEPKEEEEIIQIEEDDDLMDLDDDFDLSEELIVEEEDAFDSDEDDNISPYAGQDGGGVFGKSTLFEED